jgi:hypothetical protein
MTSHITSVTIAVCTWNRCDQLRKTLEQMTRLRVPAGVSLEVLVVNNRSSDDTDGVIGSFSGRLPIHRAWEERPGLSNARNRAVAEARGEYILWIDDDIFVEEKWLEAYVEAFHRWPDADIFGGPIEPLFEGDPPAWITAVLDRIGPVYGRQTFGDEPVQLNPDNISYGPYGGNMGMRRSALMKAPFDPDLGVCHGSYSIGEETSVIKRLLSDGCTGWWTPGPRVQHWVPASSQTMEYVRRWMVGCGKGELRLKGDGPGITPRRMFGLARRALWHEIRYRLGRHARPPEVWINDLIQAGKAYGAIRGIADIRFNRKVHD